MNKSQNEKQKPLQKLSIKYTPFNNFLSIFMNIFIDSISSPAFIALFDWERNIVNEIQVEIKWNESSKLIPDLMTFLKDNNINQDDLNNIVVVNWPGSFTWVRTVVLIANTLNYVLKKSMTPVSYFDLFSTYPIIKSSSRRDHFVQLTWQSNIEIINNSDLEKYFLDNNIDTTYWESSYNFENTQILENIDYKSIIKELEFKDYEKIEPLYIKKPNIS